MSLKAGFFISICFLTSLAGFMSKISLAALTGGRIGHLRSYSIALKIFPASWYMYNFQFEGLYSRTIAVNIFPAKAKMRHYSLASTMANG